MLKQFRRSEGRRHQTIQSRRIWEDVMGFRLSGAWGATILSACLAVSTLAAAKDTTPTAPTEPPLKVLVLPVDFDMLEFTASGLIEPVPKDTTQAEEQLQGATLRVLRLSKKFQI